MPTRPPANPFAADSGPHGREWLLPGLCPEAWAYWFLVENEALRVVLSQSR
jgi:hypothetical protein